MVDSCQNDLQLGNKRQVKYKHFVFFTVIQSVKPSYQLGQVLTKAFHTYYNEKLNKTKTLMSQYTHQRQINVETMLIINVHQRCLNFYIWLKMKIEPTYIYRRCFNFEMKLSFLL